MHPLRPFARHRPFAALALCAACLGSGCAAGRQAASVDDAVAVTPGEGASQAIVKEQRRLALSARVENVMPRGLTTVGAATLDDALYLVGGYFGSPHEYSKDFQSGSVTRLDLSSGAWQDLASVEPIQSPAVASDGRHLYKLGGMRALNAAGSPTNLRSVADAERFDPAHNRWEPLPGLPEPRSSHQAVVVGHTLYVLGGWALHGGMNDNTWSTTMLTADLSQPTLTWKSVPVPFQVRAQGLAAHRGKLYVLGGLDPEGSTDRVQRYDLATAEWSGGPALPADNMTTRAAVWQDQLYANGADGNVYRLSNDESQWELAGAVKFPRLFHEMVATERGPLILGGIPNNGRGGRVRVIERVSTEPAPTGVIWTLAAESPAKNRQGAFLWSQQLFLFGGNGSLGQHDFAPENFVSTAVRLDLGALEWRAVPDFPAARQSMQGLVVGKEQETALVLGGFGYEGTHLSTHPDVFSYDVMKREWTALPGQQLPDGRSQFGVAEWKGEVWAFGGMSFDARRETDDQIRHTKQVLKLELAKPDARFEDAGVALGEPRRAFAGALLGDRYYLTGGLKESFEPVQSCEVLHLAQKQAQPLPCPSEHRLGAELVALGGKLYLVGGSVAVAGGERQPTKSIEVFDPEHGRWSKLAAPVPLESADQLRAFAFQGQLLLYTAQRADGQVQVAWLDTEALAAGKQDYTKLTVPPPPAPAGTALASPQVSR